MQRTSREGNQLLKLLLVLAGVCLGWLIYEIANAPPDGTEVILCADGKTGDIGYKEVPT